MSNEMDLSTAISKIDVEHVVSEYLRKTWFWAPVDVPIDADRASAQCPELAGRDKIPSTELAKVIARAIVENPRQWLRGNNQPLVHWVIGIKLEVDLFLSAIVQRCAA